MTWVTRESHVFNTVAFDNLSNSETIPCNSTIRKVLKIAFMILVNKWYQIFSYPLCSCKSWTTKDQLLLWGIPVVTFISIIFNKNLIASRVQLSEKKKKGECYRHIISILSSKNDSKSHHKEHSDRFDEIVRIPCCIALLSVFLRSRILIRQLRRGMKRA